MIGSPSAGRVGAVFGALLVPSFIALGAPSVALPSLARDLHVPFGATAWVLAPWALTSALAMPIFGTVSGRIGLRRSVVVGVVLVTAGSVLAAVGPVLAVVVAGRAVGGAGAGALVIAGYATVTAVLPDADRARALGIVAAAGATASGCGTLVGGVLTAWPGWRLVLALPALALVVSVPAARLAPDRRSPTDRLDVPGAALLTALGGAVVALLQARSTGLGAGVVTALVVVGVLAGAGVVARTRRRPDGFVPRRVVTAPGFAAAGVVGLTVFAAYYGAVFAVPALVARATGWGAAAVGAALLPCAAFSVLGARAGAALGRRLTVGAVAVVLTAVSTVGVLVAALPPLVAAVAGLALTTAAFAGGQAVLFGLVPRMVEHRDATAAQGLFALAVYGGSSIGPAVVGGLSAALPLAAALAVGAVLPAAGIAAGLLLRRRSFAPAAASQ